MTNSKTEQIGFLLLPHFPLLSFSAAVEPLRLANRQTDQALYAWHLLTTDGNPVRSSSGIEIRPHAAITDVVSLDMLIVVAGAGSESYKDKHTLDQLKRYAARGCAMGALTLGTYLLARAGLLKGYRCTVHWEYLEAFREEFSQLKVTPEVFEIDRNRLTCSGGTAALDMTLCYMGLQRGWNLATEVADLFIHERIRDDDTQRMPLRTRLGVSHPKLLHAIALMESSADKVLSRDELAKQVALSGRQLERLFQKYLGTTPKQYYLQFRLWRARNLLRQTTLPVIEVAVACGFSTASHFSKSYRDRFGITPREERVRGHAQ
ncbi:MAG: GlxA family transcriptional regulator [Acidiferrobacterales bacterium]